MKERTEPDPHAQCHLRVFVEGDVNERSIAMALSVWSWLIRPGRSNQGLDMIGIACLGTISVMTVKRTIPGMESKGWVERDDRECRGPLRFRLTASRLSFLEARDLLIKKLKLIRLEKVLLDQIELPFDSVCASQNTNLIQPPSIVRKESLKEDLNNPPAPDGAFDLFYAKYPRKKSKGQALRAWAKIKPDASVFGLIMAGLDRAIKSPEWQPSKKGNFIPYPASWLNAIGWEDVITDGQSTPRLGGPGRSCAGCARTITVSETWECCGVNRCWTCQRAHDVAIHPEMIVPTEKTGEAA